MADPDPIARLNAALASRYRIERKLGEGGMATVYLAEDLKHERNVALKVLRPELAAVVGADRFLAEIKTTANLQHPHILPLHDSGEADGLLFYVMPYVQGESLRERLEREHQLPVHDALRIATDVAEALDYAHRQGVIHRDIKPANVLLQDGKPVLGDFGIALAVGAAGGGRLTETGLSLGTPHYMSPEQATGELHVGPSTDIYSLGCVLYEMLVGEPPFTGSTHQSVLGKIIAGETPSARKERSSVPPNVDAALTKALERLPADRFEDGASFIGAVTDDSFSYERDSPRPRRRRRAVGPIAFSIAGLMIGGFLGWLAGSYPKPAQPVVRERIEPLSRGIDRLIGTYTAMAPDGSSIVYAHPEDGTSSWSLALLARDAVDPVALSGTEMARGPVFSPDGRWIAYHRSDQIVKRHLTDATTLVLAPGDVPETSVALAWLDDGTIVYEGRGRTLWKVPDTGGEHELVADLSDYQQLAYAGALPGSPRVLVTLCPLACNLGAELHVVDLNTGARARLLEGAIRGWYLSTGHLLYVVSGGDVFAAPFDLKGLQLEGPGVLLLEGVHVEISSPELAIGRDGTLLYRTGADAPSSGREILWVDRSGMTEALAVPSEPYTDVALSPDETRLALVVFDPESLSGELWLKELPDGGLTRLSAQGENAIRPVWSLDGRWISYIHRDAGGYSARRVSVDGTSSELLFSLGDSVLLEVANAPIEGHYVFRTGSVAGTGTADVGMVDLRSDRVVSLLDSEALQRAPTVSPDGRWMAYVSNASGRDDVYVRSFPSMADRVAVSPEGGSDPVWRPDGGELFYIAADGWLTSVSYAPEAPFTVSRRSRIFDAGDFFRLNSDWRGFDSTNDGRRFLMIAPGAPDVAVEGRDGMTVLVRNFLEELERLLPN